MGPGWQQKRRITRSTSQQRLLEQQQWFRQHHQMQQEYQLQMQKQQLNHQRASFSVLPASSTSSSTATSSITAVSNANSSRQHPYSHPQFGGNGNPSSSNSSAYNNTGMFSQPGVLHPPQNLRPSFYPPIPPMHYCPQCPPMINPHPPSMVAGGFVHPGVGSSQHLPPPAYPNNNMAPSTTSSTKISTQSAATTSSTTNGSSSRKRSYAEATASGSIQQQQIQQRMQFHQHIQQQAQAEDHRQQMNMRIGNNVASQDDRSKTKTTSSGSSKRSRMSSSSTTSSNANKGGRSNVSNDVRNSTENSQVAKPSSTASAVVHEKLPNGVCSCGATGQFIPPSQGGLVNPGPSNQGNVPTSRSMAPPAAHSNQRPQVHPQSQLHQRHQNQLMHQQWALSAHQRQRWSSSMVCYPPPLPAPPPPISGQPTFPTSHYWNEIVPTTTAATNSSNFQAPRPVRQTTSSNKRTLRSQQQNQTDQYSQNGNQTVT